MRRIGVAVRVLLVIALFGLPCWVCSRKGLMMGLWRSGISMRGPGVFLRIAQGMRMMGGFMARRRMQACLG